MERDTWEREKDSWREGGTEPHRSPIRPRRPRRRWLQIGPCRLPRRPLPDVHQPPGPLPLLPFSAGAEAAEAAAARRPGDAAARRPLWPQWWLGTRMSAAIM